MKAWVMKTMILRTTQNPRKKKPNITTVGLETSIDYFMARTANIEGRHTPVTVIWLLKRRLTDQTQRRLLWHQHWFNMNRHASRRQTNQFQKPPKPNDCSIQIKSEHEACGFGYQVVRYDGQATELKMSLKYF